MSLEVSPGVNPQILVADDQPDILQALRLLLVDAGFEVDLVRALAKKLGTQARFVQVERFGDLLAAGRKPWDLAVGEVTITDKRDRRVDFSDPYLLAD